MKHLFQLIRPHWTIASTLACMVGIFQAWDEGYFNIYVSVLILMASFVAHAFMEVWDELKDYAHYRSTVYDEPTQPPTLFSGGSGVLTGKLLTVKQVWVFFYFLIALYVCLLSVLVYLIGYQILIYVAVGLFFIFGYNSKLKLSYNGLGEFANFISFGPILVFWAYTGVKLGAMAASGNPFTSWNVFGLLNSTIIQESLVLGVTWFASLHIQEMLDYDEDKQGGKRTLVVRYGKKYASQVPFVCSMVILALVAGLMYAHWSFAIVLPAAFINMYETYDFMKKWEDEAYFFRKMKSFFIYKNFILLGFSILGAYLIKTMGDDVLTEQGLPLFTLAVISSLPAFYFLFKRKVFRLF